MKNRSAFPVCILLAVLLMLTAVLPCGAAFAATPAEEAGAVFDEHGNVLERPSYFSLKDLGYVTSVKNQAPYGTC